MAKQIPTREEMIKKWQEADAEAKATPLAFRRRL